MRALLARPAPAFGIVALALLATSSAGLAAPPGEGRQEAAAASVTTPLLVVPGRPPAFRWPAAGEAAVGVSGTGILASSPRERRVPIASLTKMMTALVVLADHPLRPGQTGPDVAISPADVADYTVETAAGDSTVRVQAGEVLSEFQLLEALLMPSGDNIADRLATWDAGSIEAFVAKMNALAARLGLTATHYADASGVDPRSASTARDQALVAARLIESPLIRSIVGRSRAPFPVTGTIPNPNPALGIDGIIGLKGGYSSEAHNCLITAAYRAGRRVLVVSVALGQPLRAAPARIDEQLLETASSTLERERLALPRSPVGRILDAAGGGFDQVFAASAPTPPLVVWPGLVLSEKLSAAAGARVATAAPGGVVGTLTLSAPWGELAAIPVHLAPPPAPALAALARGAAALAGGAAGG